MPQARLQKCRMEHVDTENLRYLLEVARTGRLREAAARLQVDETTVSRRISRLEQELGVRMFDRTPQGWRIKLMRVIWGRITEPANGWKEAVPPIVS